MEEKFEMVAKTFQGLEDVLRDELIDLGAENVQIGTRMVTFEGDNEIMYRANLCCRTALRILKPIVKFDAESTDDLYDKVRDLEWEQFLDPDSTFAIDSTVNGDDFTHSKFVTYRVKDGIADHFSDRYGKRPSIRLSGADVILNVHISDNRVTISLDSSGEPLFKRGYRVEQSDAPINEVLAAGIILKTGWRGDSDFIDPMCGSGTFLIEAALIAANINPGIYRESFAFERWKDFDKELFEDIYNDDSAEREFAYKIYGGDIDPATLAMARKNVKSAKVDDMVELSCRSAMDWEKPSFEGIIVTNPPYGERLKPENINQLYRDFGSLLKKNFQGWHAWIIGYRDEQFSEIGLKPSVKIPLHNGNLECSLREYVMFDGKYSEFRQDGGSIGNIEAKKDAGPKKMHHITDDDWDKQKRKFSGMKNSGDDKKKKKNFTREDKFSRPERKPFGDDSHDFENDQPRRYNGDSRNDNRKDKRPFNNGDRNHGRSNDRDFGKSGGRNFVKGGDRSFGRSGDQRDRKPSNQKNGGVNYNPNNSKGPKIPKSEERVINQVYMRSRKHRQQENDED